jgi:hypothetical protein
MRGCCRRRSTSWSAAVADSLIAWLATRVAADPAIPPENRAALREQTAHVLRVLLGMRPE